MNCNNYGTIKFVITDLNNETNVMDFQAFLHHFLDGLQGNCSGSDSGGRHICLYRGQEHIPGCFCTSIVVSSC